MVLVRCLVGVRNGDFDARLRLPGEGLWYPVLPHGTRTLSHQKSIEHALCGFLMMMMLMMMNTWWVG